MRTERCLSCGAVCHGDSIISHHCDPDEVRRFAACFDNDLEPWDDPELPADTPSSHDHRCPSCGCLHLCTDLDCGAPYETECAACL